MRMTKQTWLGGLILAAWLAAESVIGQDATPTNIKPTRPGTPSDQVRTIRDQGRKIGIATPRASSGVSAVDHPEVTQPTDLKDMITRFQAAREDYLKKQRLLALRLRQANDQDRAALRELMRANLDKWREQQLEFRAQVKERVLELRRELQGQLREVVDEGGKEGAGERRRQ